MWLAALATLFAWLSGGAGVLIAAHIESEQSYDEQLVDVARVILSFAEHEIEEIRADGRTDLIHQETAATLDPRYAYQVWSMDGKLLLLSHNAPREAFAPLGKEGKVDLDIDGKPFCVYTMRNSDSTMQIQVAEDESMRGFLTPHLDVLLIVFFLVSTGLLLLFNRWFLGRAMRAVDQSAQQLTNRSPHDLRPVRADDPPSELQPMLDSVNTLFSRIERTLDSERHFTAAAAHELRTPLAAVRIQAQVAERARCGEEAKTALKSLLACVDRASRMIDQLLTLAHVESLAPGSSAFAPVRIDEVVEQVVQDLEPLLESVRVKVALELEPATVSAIEFGIAALVRNLIDNAARHASHGGEIIVRAFARGDEVMLTVEDAGPGIPESERARVFERFYRLPESETDGCGVGLSIVQCVADAHRARVALDTSPLGGLRVTVIFPRL
jgi:two-component system OmpR family sensor kinase/two-component system sensor histidine kinase QseC